MLKIGITGGIGSGKSSVCREFEQLGVPVYDSDARAKYLMANDPDLKESLINQFGTSVYTQEGVLDRAFLAKIVFNDKRQLELLNGLVHPQVIKDSYAWFENQASKNVGYAIKESALLYEIGMADQFDQVIVVAAPLEVRVQRVMKRDSVSADEVQQRIEKQMPQHQKVQLADHVIQNESWDGMRSEVMRLDRYFRSLST